MTAQSISNRSNRRWILWLGIAVALVLLSCCCISLATGTFFGGRASVAAPQTEVVPPTETQQDPEVPPTQAPQADWPETPQQAAALFGATSDRWELSAEGGWHLMESYERVVVSPGPFVLEGYYDTAPGKNPRQFVATVAIELQGGTVWPLGHERAGELFSAMAQQKGYTTEQATEYIERVGW